jgi:hypothetical protein
MKRPIALLLLLLAAPTFAADPPASGKPFTATLEPRKMHEECVKLDAGEKRKYYWKSDAAVDFNIHYHEGPEVFYPVKREGMRTDGGTFAAKIAQDYCWMWTARDKAAKLEGKIEK